MQKMRNREKKFLISDSGSWIAHIRRHSVPRPIAAIAASILLLPGFSGCDQKSTTHEHAPSEAHRQKQSTQYSPKITVKSSLPHSSLRHDDDHISKAEKDLRASSQSSRWDAVDALVKDGSERAVEILAAYIESLPLNSTREEVVRRASTISDKRALPPVLELLSHAEDPSVFRMAQEIFIRLADAQAIQDVLDRYDGSTDVEERTRLAKTISLTSAEEAVEPLRLVVFDGGQPAGDGMVLAGASALARIGTQPAIDTLLERLNAEQTDEGRYLIAARLAEVRSPSAETTLQGAALGGGKFSTQLQTRITAIGTLINYPSTETQELLASLASDPAPGVAEAAEEVLGEIQRRLATK